MVTVYQIVLALLILQVYISAAPTDAPVPEVTPKVDDENPTSNVPSPLEHSKEDSNSNENQRQKRFYSHYGFGVPPINPVQYPYYNKRDIASDLGLYGIDDPLNQIQKQLHEIAFLARNPPTPPPHLTPHPVFFPVIYVPSFGCDCRTDSDTSQSTPKPDTQSTEPTKPSVDTATTPDIFSRWPELDDERQNWGLVVNETGEYDGEDFNRPISFDPIELNLSMSRPAPPVEHGTNQAGSQSGTSSTTAKPGPPSTPRPPKNNRPRPPSNGQPISPANNPFSLGTPASSSQSPGEAPTTCDGAILSCCHQLHVSYECFSILGCPDPTAYGNPCNSLVILKVIEKYQKYYGVRNGLPIS